MCPSSRFYVVAPRFDAKARFNESFTDVDGSGRMAIATLTAGTNGLSAFTGELTYKGSLTDVHGQVKLAAQKSRLATIYADRTAAVRRLSAWAERREVHHARRICRGQLKARSFDARRVIEPLKAAAGTPIGPVTTSISKALSRTASNFNIGGHITVVNFPGGGAARITEANIIGPNQARAKHFGR